MSAAAAGGGAGRSGGAAAAAAAAGAGQLSAEVTQHAAYQALANAYPHSEQINPRGPGANDVIRERDPTFFEKLGRRIRRRPTDPRVAKAVGFEEKPAHLLGVPYNAVKSFTPAHIGQKAWATVGGFFSSSVKRGVKDGMRVKTEYHRESLPRPDAEKLMSKHGFIPGDKESMADYLAQDNVRRQIVSAYGHQYVRVDTFPGESMFIFIPSGNPGKARLMRAFRPDTLKAWKKEADFERAVRMYCATEDSRKENYDEDLGKRITMLKIKMRDEIVINLRDTNPGWDEDQVQQQADTDIKAISEKRFQQLAKKSMRFYVINEHGYRIYSEADPNNNRLNKPRYGLAGEFDKDAQRAITEVLHAKDGDEPKTVHPFRAAPPAPKKKGSGKAEA